MFEETGPEDRAVEVAFDTMQDGLMVERERGTRNILRFLTMGNWLVIDENGNEVSMPTQCGWRHNATESALTYKNVLQVTAMAHGFLPVNECPHTVMHTNRIYGEGAPPTRLLPIPKDASDKEIAAINNCAGKPGGCVHLLAEKTKRLTACREAYDKLYDKDPVIALKNVEQMAKAFALAGNYAANERKTTRD